MKQKVFSIILLLLGTVLSAVQLKLIDTVTLTGDGKDDFLKAPAPFAVSEDGFYLVPDYKEGDIKAFDMKGRLLKRVGRKGQGPSELIEPRDSDYQDRQLVVLDMGRRAYILYTRDQESFFKETKYFRNMYMGNDVALMKDSKILVDGHKPDNDGNSWELYIYDFKNGQYKHLIRTETKYGFDTFKAYENAGEDISAIGSGGYCDWWGDYAYFTWTGNLKIFRIDLNSGKTTTFGSKTANYQQPVATDRLKKALKEQNLKVWGQEMRKFSMIMGIYTNKNYLLVMYERPLVNGEEIKSRMLQFYSLDGTFINELQITQGSGCALYLSKDRDDGILYMITWVPATDKEDEYYQATRFKMIE
jgi:hypothetical protein